MGIVDVRQGQRIVDVRRDAVQEWLLPTPLTAIGEATVDVSGNQTDTVASVLGSAPAAITALAPTIVQGLIGEAVADLFGSVFSYPLPLADAVVEIDATGSGLKDVAAPAAVAEIEITGSVAAQASISAIAALLLTSDTPIAVEVIGDAEVEFTYSGDGNYPIFPYRFPALFTDNPFNIQDAAALVAPVGVGDMDAASGFAEVMLPAFTGDVELTIKGSTPILPWFFPIVFDDLPANVSAGAALVLLDMASDSAVVLDGEAEAAINAPGSSLPSAVFPWTFPVILIGAV